MSVLAGVRVLELATSSLGVAYAGRILAELGADVVKIEPPGGDPWRSHEAAADVEGVGPTGSAFAYANRGKRSATVDLADARAGWLVQRLARGAQILLDDLSPEERDRLGLCRDILADTSLIHISVRPFGSYGERYHDAATPLVVSHAGGESFINPSGVDFLDRPPLKLAAHAQEYDSGSVAAMIALAGLYEGAEAGYRFCDIADQDVQATMVRPEIVTAFVTGVEETRATRVHEFGGPLRCKDGWVHVVIKEAAQWNGLVDIMGRPDWATDPRFQTREARFEDGFALTARMSEWLLTQERHDLMRRAQAASVPIVAIETPVDVVESAQLQERGFLHRIPFRDGAGVLAPSVLPAPGFSDPASNALPARGEHTADVLREWAGLSMEERDAVHAGRS
jgi:crotonobetainyl-CoA:carnitine CoA-transferase CaiB-like acyl-CoA transferase